MGTADGGFPRWVFVSDWDGIHHEALMVGGPRPKTVCPLGLQASAMTGPDHTSLFSEVHSVGGEEVSEDLVDFISDLWRGDLHRVVEVTEELDMFQVPGGGGEGDVAPLLRRFPKGLPKLPNRMLEVPGEGQRGW